MQSANFVALTGHLNEYPLADLISILRRRGKTGRLLIEYPVGPCSLYFDEGNLVDAQLNSLGGMQAVLVALSQPNSSFNFNPLIEPTRRSISESSQKVVLELMGCWEERIIDIGAAQGGGRLFSADSSHEALLAYPIETQQEALPVAKEPLALPPSPFESTARRPHRQVLIVSAVISLLVSILTVGALTRWLIKRDLTSALSEIVKKESTSVEGDGTGANVQTVKVAVRVEQGRVSEAFVEEHHPGMEAFEAMALRIARARRYAQTASGQETVLVRINSPG